MLTAVVAVRLLNGDAFTTYNVKYWFSSIAVIVDTGIPIFVRILSAKYVVTWYEYGLLSEYVYSVPVDNDEDGKSVVTVSNAAFSSLYTIPFTLIASLSFILFVDDIM